MIGQPRAVIYVDIVRRALVQLVDNMNPGQEADFHSSADRNVRRSAARFVWESRSAVRADRTLVTFSMRPKRLVCVLHQLRSNAIIPVSLLAAEGTVNSSALPDRNGK